MEQLWPLPSPDVADAIRSSCQQLLSDAGELTDALTEPARAAQHEPNLLSDASLAEEDRQLNRSDAVQWLTSNVQQPGKRVDPYIGPRTSAYIRDLASRGIAPDFAEGWRAALAVGWRRWLEVCVAQDVTPDVLVEVLDLSAQSMMQYALDSMTALREVIVATGTGTADADAIAMIQLIANGAPVTQERAEGRLSYRMSRWHGAVILWADDLEQVDGLNEAIAGVRSVTAGRSALVARASTTSRWMWVSGTDAPDLHQVERVLANVEGVHAAVGRSGQGLEGFRSSHLDALAAQAMVVRLGSDRRFTDYADVELIDTLTRDRASAQRFVTMTLGPLAEADEELRQALLTYVQCGFNTTRTAAKLYAHRNTVERRVSRANELSVVKVEDNPTHVAAALLVLEVAPDLVSTSTT
ncbi:PucR family transcriptional regulator [Aeromicrobium sp. CTD01-1L150]|uniref:PucR family transcriptional regulator n=1 Tax=Aeromicrobium sp. CTD01-1L150 TaxID=3341830 RepID=UPI0035C05145